ncbi:MAG: flavodoxin family protein [Desulfobacteraceae bacterium]|jgi:multimeric flavodoxin WrbA
MKIITILGSPRKKGNTARVLSMFEEKVQMNHAIERIDIARHKVGGCLGCMQCKEKMDEPGCVQNDDALTIFEKMMRADAIVYASPLYCWSFSSQIKPLIDRHFCLVSGEGSPEHDSLISGKPAALLVTCAGPIEGNCDAIKHIFAGFADYLNLSDRGNFILPFCTTPDEIGDQGVNLAESLAKAITA